MRPEAQRDSNSDGCRGIEDSLRGKNNIRPEAGMVRALRGIPGASYARWFKVGIRKSHGRAMALIPCGVSRISRDRLFFVSHDAVVEIILGCPKCRKELFKIGAAQCHNCGFWLVFSSDKGRKTNWKRKLSTAATVMGFLGWALSMRGTAENTVKSTVLLLVSFISAIVGLTTPYTEKVKLLYRFRADGKFIMSRIVKLNPKQYVSAQVASSVGTALLDDLVRAADVKRTRERALRTESDSIVTIRAGRDLSAGFSLGKAEQR